MKYAILDSDGNLVQTVAKLVPTLKIEPGCRIAESNIPDYDPKLEQLAPILPCITTKLEYTKVFLDIEAKAVLEQEAQALLDAKAKSLGYDNIISGCSYIFSTNEKYRVEGHMLSSIRDSVWQYIEQIGNITSLSDYTTHLNEVKTICQS